MAFNKRRRKKTAESTETSVEPVVEKTTVDVPTVGEVVDSIESLDSNEAALSEAISTKQPELLEETPVVEEVKEQPEDEPKEQSKVEAPKEIPKTEVPKVKETKVEKPKTKEPKVVAKVITEKPKVTVKKLPIDPAKKPEFERMVKTVGWIRFFPGLK